VTEFDWGILLRYHRELLAGLRATVVLTVVGLAGSLALGIVVGVGRTARPRWVRWVFAGYVELFRNVPLVVQMFFWFFAAGLGSLAAAIIGLVCYSAAYVSEVVRAGLQAIPRGVGDAALSVGLSPLQAVRHVVLPYALMITIPPLTNEALNVLKNSSVAMTVAVAELTFQTQAINAYTFRGFEAATAVTCGYLGLGLVLVVAATVLQRRLGVARRVG
jgi:polar amino acid transport system permease protein